jgi:hypothetical protein
MFFMVASSFEWIDHEFSILDPDSSLSAARDLPQKFARTRAIRRQPFAVGAHFAVDQLAGAHLTRVK